MNRSESRTDRNAAINLNESSTIVVAHQVGLTVAESSDLRAKMREAGAGFKVTKNRIAKLALKGTRFEELEPLFTGPTAVGTSTDPVAAAKTLVDYAKGNNKVTIVGGSMDGKTLDKAGVEALAKMPSLDELRGKLVGLLQAPQLKWHVLQRLRPARWRVIGTRRSIAAGHITARLVFQAQCSKY